MDIYDSFFMGIEFECPQKDMDFYFCFFLRYCHVGFSSIKKKGCLKKYYRDCQISKQKYSFKSVLCCCVFFWRK